MILSTVIPSKARALVEASFFMEPRVLSVDERRAVGFMPSGNRSCSVVLSDVCESFSSTSLVFLPNTRSPVLEIRFCCSRARADLVSCCCAWGCAWCGKKLRSCHHVGVGVIVAFDVLDLLIEAKNRYTGNRSHTSSSRCQSASLADLIYFRFIIACPRHQYATGRSDSGFLVCSQPRRSRLEHGYCGR